MSNDSATDADSRPGEARVNVCVEVCVDSVASAIAAEAGGADRIELCSELRCDGLTPTAELAEAVLAAVTIPVVAMVRPRHTGFETFRLTSQDRILVDADLRRLVQLPFAGFVFGALTSAGELDHEACRQVLEQASQRPVTLHRAFDRTANPTHSLEAAIQLGFSRVLTSGQAASAWEGRKQLQSLVSASGDRITILAGGGVRAEQAAALVAATGVREVHSSARTRGSTVASRTEVAAIVHAVGSTR
ncbi:MAG: copper homeostasis protein CutC [Planctomycetota bacterium]